MAQNVMHFFLAHSWVMPLILSVLFVTAILVKREQKPRHAEYLKMEASA